MRGGAPLAAAVGLATLTLVSVATRPAGSPLAAVVALAPFVVAIAVVLAAAAAVRARRTAVRMAAGIVALVLVTTLVAPPVLAGAGGESLPPGDDDIVLLSWNTHDLGPSALQEETAAVDADVVVLIEANRWQLRRAPGLEARFPHRWVSPEDGAIPGLVVLSRWPLERRGVLGRLDATWDRLRVGWITVATPAGPLVVVGIHTANPLVDAPLGFGSRRDRQLARTCELLHDLDDGPAPVVIAGDFNVSTRERGWDCVGAWGTDVWGAVGDGPGATWRPGPWRRLPAVLRIDHVVVSDGVEPVMQRVRCHVPGSDHCPLVSRLRLR